MKTVICKVMKTLFMLIAVSFCHVYLMAQDTAENNVPQLNGHYFIPVSVIQSPFIKSHFTMNLGVAQSSEFENVILEIDGQKILGLKGTLIFANLDFEYQQKIKDWIALYINYSLTARLGTELQSILTQGVNTVGSSRIGWLIKIAETEKFMLSGDIQVNNHSATFISISEFVKDLVNDSIVTSISRQVPILNMNAGLRWAYGINKTFGLQGFADVGYGDSYKRGVSDYIYRIGIAFDANLAFTTKIPLGFSAFFNASAMPDYVHVAGKSALNTGLKISYAAGPHFNIGLELSRVRIPIPNVEEKVNSTSAFISSRYYFN
jgi:hypothetical protein